VPQQRHAAPQPNHDSNSWVPPHEPRSHTLSVAQRPPSSHGPLHSTAGQPQQPWWRRSLDKLRPTTKSSACVASRGLGCGCDALRRRRQPDATAAAANTAAAVSLTHTTGVHISLEMLLLSAVVYGGAAVPRIPRRQL
jgi:hypothetical protein